MMTPADIAPADIAQHNATLAQLTAEDGIPRLSWEQHGAAFEQPVPTSLAAGQLVAAEDSATPGTVVAVFANGYDVAFPDLPGHTPCRYSSEALRPWPQS